MSKAGLKAIKEVQAYLDSLSDEEIEELLDVLKQISSNENYKELEQAILKKNDSDA